MSRRALFIFGFVFLFFLGFGAVVLKERFVPSAAPAAAPEALNPATPALLPEPGVQKKILSQVGPYQTVMLTFEGGCDSDDNCTDLESAPSHRLMIVDLNSPEPIRLDRFFSVAEIAEGLKANSAFNAAFEKDRDCTKSPLWSGKISSFSELLSQLKKLKPVFGYNSEDNKDSDGTCEGFYDPDFDFTNAGFKSYDSATGMATIQLGLVINSTGMCNGNFPRLTIQLKVSPDFKDMFAQAQSGKGGFFRPDDEWAICPGCTSQFDVVTAGFEGKCD